VLCVGPHNVTKLTHCQVLNMFIKWDFDVLKSKDNNYLVAQLHAVRGSHRGGGVSGRTKKVEGRRSRI